MSTATLTWTAPTTRADGSPLAPEQIASTHILDGTSKIGEVTGAAASFTTGVLAGGEHSFTVAVTDIEGNLSAPSNAAVVTIAAAPPAAVSDLTATVNA